MSPQTWWLAERLYESIRRPHEVSWAARPPWLHAQYLEQAAVLVEELRTVGAVITLEKPKAVEAS